MKLFHGLHSIRRPLTGCVATLGVFDGVHAGHRRIIRKVVRLARAHRTTSLVLTFDLHPLEVLSPAVSPYYLTTLDQKLRLIEGLGVDAAAVIPFTRRFASLDAERFVRRVLVAKLGIRVFVVGRKYRFGRQGRGDLRLLRRLGRELGFQVHEVPPALSGGRPVSSTRIRGLVQKGDVRGAARLLGRPYGITGIVTRGARIGRRLTFPTANLLPGHKVMPSRGVYAIRARAGRRTVMGVCNVGVRPTFGRHLPTLCEAHLLGFHGNLYGRPLEIEFIHRLRGEKKFSGPDALRLQIARDIRRTRRLLGGR